MMGKSIRLEIILFVLTLTIFSGCQGYDPPPAPLEQERSGGIERMTVTESILLARLDYTYSPSGEANAVTIHQGVEPETVTAIQGDKFYRILDNTYLWNNGLLTRVGMKGKQLDILYIGNKPDVAWETESLTGDTLRIFKMEFEGNNISALRVYNARGENLVNHHWSSYDSSPNAYSDIWWVWHVGLIEEPIFVEDIPILLFMVNNPGRYKKEIPGNNTTEYNTHYSYNGYGKVVNHSVRSDDYRRYYKMIYELEM